MDLKKESDLERTIILKKKYGLNEVWPDFDYIMKARSVGWNQSYAVNSNIFEKIIDDYKNGLWEMLDERWKGKQVERTDTTNTILNQKHMYVYLRLPRSMILSVTYKEHVKTEV